MINVLLEVQIQYPPSRWEEDVVNVHLRNDAKKSISGQGFGENICKLVVLFDIYELQNPLRNLFPDKMQIILLFLNTLHIRLLFCQVVIMFSFLFIFFFSFSFSFYIYVADNYQPDTCNLLVVDQLILIVRLFQYLFFLSSCTFFSSYHKINNFNIYIKNNL